MRSITLQEMLQKPRNNWKKNERFYLKIIQKDSVIHTNSFAKYSSLENSDFFIYIFD